MAQHHHHHVHPSHHHHHPPKSVASPPAPEVAILNQTIMNQIADLPRSHLGTALYESSLSLPPSKRVLIDTRLMFVSTSGTLPDFEGHENCTFTIRVPREYLISSDATHVDDEVAGGLEEICKRRAIWGSEIYTDDSDVVAAAVHSGWVKGDFGDFNEDIKDLFGEERESPSKLDLQLKSLTSRPSRPVLIPPQRDLRITILILPPLQEYAASTKHNIRSRAWGADHDGMSFMIHSIDFVDEPRPARFVDRGAKAKKSRLRDEQRRRREAAESLLGLSGGIVSRKAYVAAAV